MPEGNNIILIWVFILAEAGESNKDGALYLTDTIPFTCEDLAIEFDFEIDLIKLALTVLERFQMIEIFDDVIYIKNWDKYQNIDGLDKIREQTRLRVAKCREKKKLQSPPCNVTCNGEVTDGNAIEVEGDIDIDTTTSPTTKKSPDKSYLDFFNNNFGHLISPFEIETLQSYVDDGIESAVITMALQEAIEADKKDMRYVKTILNRWLEHNLKTVEAVKADKRNWEDKKKQKDVSKTYRSKKETFSAFTPRPDAAETYKKLEELNQQQLQDIEVNEDSFKGIGSKVKGGIT